MYASLTGQLGDLRAGHGPHPPRVAGGPPLALPRGRRLRLPRSSQGDLTLTLTKIPPGGVRSTFKGRVERCDKHIS